MAIEGSKLNLNLPIHYKPDLKKNALTDLPTPAEKPMPKPLELPVYIGGQGGRRVKVGGVKIKHNIL